MLLDRSYLERLPSMGGLLNDITEGIRYGRSEASLILREADLADSIAKANEKILILDREQVLEYLSNMRYRLEDDHPEYDQSEQIVRGYEQGIGIHGLDRIRILINPTDTEKGPAFTKAQLLKIVSHELMHELASKEILNAGRKGFAIHGSSHHEKTNLLWLDEAITERLAQGLVQDTCITNEKWRDVYLNLKPDELERIQSASYQREREQLSKLVSEIVGSCSTYKNLISGSHWDQKKFEDTVFIDNFGKPYFTGDFSFLEKNIKELGYSSFYELEQLDPSISN